MSQIEEAVQSPLVQAVFAQAMQESVHTEVYEYYEALTYENRADKGGLSDTENMVFTKHMKVGNTVVSDFENITVGVDTMEGKFISELIENGGTQGWASPTGAWTDPRPFAQATVNKLNNSEYNKYLKVLLEKEINN